MALGDMNLKSVTKKNLDYCVKPDLSWDPRVKKDPVMRPRVLFSKSSQKNPRSTM